MHGSIFTLLKKFVQKNYDEATWESLLQGAGVGGKQYEEHTTYPDAELESILYVASGATGIAREDLLEKFGEFMVPDLLAMYQTYIRPDWRTFEMLEFTEPIMHTAARREDGAMSPPVLSAMRVSDNLLVIDYYSKRRMAGLGIGIIRGIAAYYNETDRIHIIPTTDRNAERVQLRIQRDT